MVHDAKLSLASAKEALEGTKPARKEARTLRTTHTTGTRRVTPRNCDGSHTIPALLSVETCGKTSRLLQHGSDKAGSGG